jgi:hypothetical protein
MTEIRQITQKATFSSNLTPPKWVKTGNTLVDILDNPNYVTPAIYRKFKTTTWAAKALRIDDKLLNTGEIYIQYGRLMPPFRNKGGGIRFYGVNRLVRPIGIVNPYDGSGELGGVGDYYNGDRHNCFLLTSQNQTVDNLPFWRFYTNKEGQYFTGKLSGTGSPIWASVPIPIMTGISNKGHDLLSTDYSLGNITPKTKPIKKMLKSMYKTRVLWYARLVRIKDGKLIEYGANSEALFTNPQLTVGWNSELCHYTVTEFQGTNNPITSPNYLKFFTGLDE